MSNPQQQNKLINKNMNKFNKLTKPPDTWSILKKQKPEHAWEIGLMQDTIGIMRPLTEVEKARVERWVMFWEKTYWMWINDSIPAMSSEELEDWKTKAKLKLEEFSKMWTAFGDVVSSEEAKASVEKLSDSIVKFGAAITYVTTMFSGKMMIKFRPEVKLALDSAILIFQQSIADVGAGATDLLRFFQERLKGFLRDQGLRYDVIDACIAMPNNDDLALLAKRAQALQAVLATDDGENLIQGFKRANNILSQAEDKDGVEYSYGADIKLAEGDVELVLFAALDDVDAQIKLAMDTQDFSTAMVAMATLRSPIDAFFDGVKINADSAMIRRNRLNLLSRIRIICLSVADLSKLEG